MGIGKQGELTRKTFSAIVRAAFRLVKNRGMGRIPENVYCMKKKPTIRDVAAKAGVSIATVSKFINQTQRFTAPVERKIQAAIDELQYHSNPLARSMITGKTGAVGVAILDISNPHFTNIVKGANRVALEHGYNLLFVDTEESQAREDELLDALSRRVDGLIVSTRMPEDQLGR